MISILDQTVNMGTPPLADTHYAQRHTVDFLVEKNMFKKVSAFLPPQEVLLMQLGKEDECFDKT